MVQDAQVVGRLLADVKTATLLPHLLKAQQVIGSVEQSGIVGSSYHGLVALALDGVSVLRHSLLPFQHDRSSLPVGLQLGHGRTLHTRYGSGRAVGVKPQPQTTAVLGVGTAPSCHEQEENRE